LRDQAVSTSGDAHQHVEIGGIRYSHIVDPKTGLGLIGRSSVTVVAPDCTTSDALATAASVLGPAKGSKLIESTRGAAGLFTQTTAEGVSAVETNQWKEQYRER
jgi:thiamine biosynthesis lipoprotein